MGHRNRLVGNASIPLARQGLSLLLWLCETCLLGEEGWGQLLSRNAPVERCIALAGVLYHALNSDNLKFIILIK